MDKNAYKVELVRTHKDNYSVSFKYGDIELIKNENFDMFSLGSIINTIEKIIHKKFNIQSYLSSYKFYQQLTRIDDELPKLDFIYLKILDKENKICKIGRTFNIQKHHDKKLTDNTELLIPVSDTDKVKEQLIKVFSEKLININDTNKFFMYDSLKNVIDIFQKVADEYKVDISYKHSKYIQVHNDDGKHDRIYITLPVCELIFNNYVSIPEYIEQFNTMKQFITDSLHNDVYSCKYYNTMLETNCTIWKFHKYIIIQNDNDLYVNGSKLWDSIIEGDNLDKQNTFKKFLKTKRVRQISEQFEKLYPGQTLYRENVINKSQPYLSGIYVHYTFAHFIITHLNAENAIQISELLYKRYIDSMSCESKSVSMDEYNMGLMKLFNNF